jgi:hypothetical protein
VGAAAVDWVLLLLMLLQLLLPCNTTGFGYALNKVSKVKLTKWDSSCNCLQMVSPGEVVVTKQHDVTQRHN